MSKKHPIDPTQRKLLDQRLKTQEHISQAVPAEKRTPLAKLLKKVVPSKLHEKSEAKQKQEDANKQKLALQKQRAVEAKEKSAAEKAVKKEELRLQAAQYKKEIIRKKEEQKKQKAKEIEAARNKVHAKKGQKTAPESRLESGYQSGVEDFYLGDELSDMSSETYTNDRAYTPDEERAFTPPSKRVSFNKMDEVGETYSSEDYDRQSVPRVDNIFAKLIRKAEGNIESDLSLMEKPFIRAYRKIYERKDRFPQASMEEILASACLNFARGIKEDKAAKPSGLSVDDKFKLLRMEKFTSDETIALAAVTLGLEGRELDELFSEDSLLNSQEREIIERRISSLYKQLLETPSAQPVGTKAKTASLKLPPIGPITSV